ncbi:hypothetical protein QBD01_002797 [Ochrobactrum sp. 19YEA23]|nr:hypothetical protein [Ochrobactrum sp. 19YEA23]
MNFSRQVSRNISLQRAGLGFIAEADASRDLLQLIDQDRHGLTKVGGLEI